MAERETVAAEAAFPARLGRFLVAPNRALGAIVRRRSGGVRDALYLVASLVSEINKLNILLPSCAATRSTN